MDDEVYLLDLLVWSVDCLFRFDLQVSRKSARTHLSRVAKYEPGCEDDERRYRGDINQSFTGMIHATTE